VNGLAPIVSGTPLSSTKKGESSHDCNNPPSGCHQAETPNPSSKLQRRSKSQAPMWEGASVRRQFSALRPSSSALSPLSFR